ncbi:YuzL family protein [Rossellomorea vietnamensis]|uniref:YuzL family protein n=1 Tax=Rossellomorea vietnamensis TaxID=218284 RepID=A0A5D4NZ10_9BACI|nr:YuzL family protein [Rossellomorea vietnamensis]
MAKNKQDPSKTGLGSAQVEGQGNTTSELPGGIKADSSRKKIRNNAKEGRDGSPAPSQPVSIPIYLFDKIN